MGRGTYVTFRLQYKMEMYMGVKKKTPKLHTRNQEII